MCTLIALQGCVPGYPLVVAMNRDEFYDRPARGPELDSGPPRIVRPSDARASGTWIGVNDAGLVAALSNRGSEPPNPGARSRGLLCIETLGAPGLADGVRFATSDARARAYLPFNLLLADASGIACLEHEGTARVRPGVLGLNVLTNGGLNAGDPRDARCRRALAGVSLRSLEDAVGALRGALGDHERAGERSICHHGERTGTRSQTVVAVSAEGWRRNRLWHTEGYPCEGDAADLSGLFG